MSELDPMLASLLRAAREDIGPTEDETRELYADIRRKIAVGSAVVVGSVLVSKTAKASGLMTLVTAKLAALSTTTTLVFGVATVGLASAYVATQIPAVTSSPTVIAPSASPVARTAGASAKRLGNALAQKALPPPVAIESKTTVAPAPSASEASVVPEASKPATVTNPQKATARGTDTPEESFQMVRELSALVAANDALTEGRPEATLRIIESLRAERAAHAPSSRGSGLAQERIGLRVLALCALGRAEAPMAARNFLHSFPSSPLAARVRASCSLEAPEAAPDSSRRGY